VTTSLKKQKFGHVADASTEIQPLAKAPVFPSVVPGAVASNDSPLEHNQDVEKAGYFEREAVLGKDQRVELTEVYAKENDGIAGNAHTDENNDTAGNAHTIENNQDVAKGATTEEDEDVRMDGTIGNDNMFEISLMVGNTEDGEKQESIREGDVRPPTGIIELVDIVQNKRPVAMPDEIGFMSPRNSAKPEQSVKVYKRTFDASFDSPEQPDQHDNWKQLHYQDVMTTPGKRRRVRHLRSDSILGTPVLASTPKTAALTLQPFTPLRAGSPTPPRSVPDVQRFVPGVGEPELHGNDHN
jgi:hypothetical protein